MDCRKFSERFGDFVEGLLSLKERRAMDEHMSQCVRCRELYTMAGGEPGDQEVVAAADLTESILSRTSGPVCASARGRLCDHVEGLLDPTGDALVSLHLRDCAECAGLSSILSSLRVDLPLLAELDPDVEFVGDVLARTRPRSRSRPAWIERFAEEWRNLIKRPRFAWEGAYVGAFLLMLIFGTSNAPLASVPQKAKEVAPQVRSSIGSVWVTTRGNVIETSSELAFDVRRRSSTVFETARETFEAARENFEAARKTLGIAREALEADRENLEAARESLGTTRESFETAREKFEADRENLEAARESLGTTRGTLETTRETLGTIRESLGTAREALEAAREALGTFWESLPLMREKDDTNQPADQSGPDEGEKP